MLPCTQPVSKGDPDRQPEHAALTQIVTRVQIHVCLTFITCFHLCASTQSLQSPPRTLALSTTAYTRPLTFGARSAPFYLLTQMDTGTGTTQTKR